MQYSEAYLKLNLIKLYLLCHRVSPVPSDPLDLLDLVEPRYGYLKPPVQVDHIK